MKIKDVRYKVNRIFELKTQIINYSFSSFIKLILIEAIDHSLPQEIKQIEFYLYQGQFQYKDTAFFDWRSYPDEMEYEVALEKYKKLKMFA